MAKSEIYLLLRKPNKLIIRTSGSKYQIFKHKPLDEKNNSTSIGFCSDFDVVVFTFVDKSHCWKKRPGEAMNPQNSLSYFLFLQLYIYICPFFVLFCFINHKCI